MYSFLDRINYDDLKKEVCSIVSKKAISEADNLSRELLYGILFGIYGYDLLYEKQIRFLLLLSLESSELENISQKVGIKKKVKKFDLCLSIANIPWRLGSKIVWIFAHAFSIPTEYLPTKSTRNETVETIEPFSPPSELFDFQDDIVSQIVDIVTLNKKKAFLVQLPTGAGKTRTLIEALITIYNQYRMDTTANSIIWLAHTEELCEQAIDTFREIWQSKGIKEIRVVRFWGNYKPNINETSGAFVVGSYQKMYSLYNKSPDDFQILTKEVKILVVDEAHKSLADTYYKIIKKIYSKNEIFLIGLTATPGRDKDSGIENIELASLFEKTLITSSILNDNPIKLLQDRKILSKIKRVTRIFDSSMELTLEEKQIVKMFNDIPTTVLKRLAANRQRNELIISLVSSEITKGNQCIVFACSVDHAKKLSIMSGMDGHKSAFIRCDMRRGFRRKTIQAFKDKSIDVIYNYGVLSTGFDAPKIQTVIIARPTSSIVLYSQMIGRGLRGSLLGGTEECNLIDIRDNFINFGDVDKVYNYFDNYWE